jgi:methylphosphotriester-DNA--protein-cysteine methyltransferase
VARCSPVAIPTVLADLFERHAPVGPRELHAAWRTRAADLGLHPGEILAVNDAAFRAGVAHPDGPYHRADVGPIFDQLEGSARARRGRWRIEVLADGTPILRQDPLGAADNLAAILGDLRPLAAAHRRRVVLEAVAAAMASPGRPSFASLAVRWQVSERTIRRWRAEGGQSAPSMTAEVAETGSTLGVGSPPSGRARSLRVPRPTSPAHDKRGKGQAA